MHKFFKMANRILNIILACIIACCGMIGIYAVLDLGHGSEKQNPTDHITSSANQVSSNTLETMEMNSFFKPDAEADKNKRMEAVDDDTSINAVSNEKHIQANETVKNDTATGDYVLPDTNQNAYFDYDSIPNFSDMPYYVINQNVPFFSDDEKVTFSFEYYSDLDHLGRCGMAYANIGVDLMPKEERGKIGQIKPSGWQTVKYNDLIDGNYLYNRCHLIGYQLAGENANELNLITGTRFLNVCGMLPFEEKVAEYVNSTNNHVLYRVTPIFYKKELVARGVLMEAYSVEDNGQGICFNVFCYNVQPGISIDYQNGDSWANGTAGTKENSNILVDTGEENTVTVLTNDEDIQDDTDNTETISSEDYKFIANMRTGKVHRPECTSVAQMNEENKRYYNGTLEDIYKELYNGVDPYTPCKICNPTD